MEDRIEKSIKFIDKSNMAKSMCQEFMFLFIAFPLPDKKLKLIDKLKPYQISGVMSAHLMSVARQCGVPHVYISKYSELKKDLSKGRNPLYVNNEFWKKYIKEAKQKVPRETSTLIRAIRCSRLFKEKMHHYSKRNDQQSINNKLKKVRNS